MKRKKGTYLTSGDVARMFDVAPRTAMRWIDTGELEFFRLPGRKLDRRVTRQSVVAFAARHGLPMPAELLPAAVVSFGLRPGEVIPGATPAADLVALGAALGRGPVAAAVVADGDGLSAAVGACRGVRAMHPKARLVLVVDESVDPAFVDPRVCDRVYQRPVSWAALVAALVAPDLQEACK